MANKFWALSEDTLFEVQYKIVWYSKFLRPVFTDEMRLTIYEVICTKANENSWIISNLNVGQNIVEIKISFQPNVSISHVVAQLKDAISSQFREKYPEMFSRLPSLWNKNFLVTTEQTVIDFADYEKWLNSQKFKRGGKKKEEQD